MFFYKAVMCTGCTLIACTATFFYKAVMCTGCALIACTATSFYKAVMCTALRTHRLYSDVLLHGGESARRRCLLLATAGVLGASAAAERYRSPITFLLLFYYCSPTVLLQFFFPLRTKQSRVESEVQRLARE